MATSKTRDAGDSTARIPVAGLGASAGGIEALREFFSAVPTDLGLAYVVIVHLAPNHGSELASILARCTSMQVMEVDDHKKLPLEANSVYVISPSRKLEIRDGMVGASSLEEPLGRRSAIDLFFRSLAESTGDGYAIILSGGGSDGALGARAVKEAGGVVLVQDPREALHEGRYEEQGVIEWLGTSTDIDELRQARERQQLLVAELQHRTRNLIGVVKALATMTARGCTDVRSFQASFGERLEALSRSQGLLSRSEEEPITLERLLRMELAALGQIDWEDRVRIAGPPVRMQKADAAVRSRCEDTVRDHLGRRSMHNRVAGEPR